MEVAVRKIEAGERFGRLLTIAPGPGIQWKCHWKCLCDCDKTIFVVVTRRYLLSSKNPSCGCVQREAKIARTEKRIALHQKTHCGRGHLLNVENTINNGGQRMCRRCLAIREDRYRSGDETLQILRDEAQRAARRNKDKKKKDRMATPASAGIQYQNYTIEEVVKMLGDGTATNERLAKWLSELLELRQFHREVLLANGRLSL